MHVLVAVVAASTLAVCVGDDPPCKDATNTFVFSNETDAPAFMFNGFESQENSIGTDTCTTATMFMLEPHKVRVADTTDTTCDEEKLVRNVSVVAGPLEGPCTSFLESYGRSDARFGAGLVISARWTGELTVTVTEADPDPL